MNTSLSDYEAYRNTCHRAATINEAFNNFKQNWEYRKILEHTGQEQGLIYSLKILNLKQLTQNDIEKAKENDQQGNPSLITYDYPFGVVSPSTLRYMSVLSEIMSHVGDLTGFTIVEVGGGYGGQCKLIKDKFDIKEYRIYDLPEPLELMKRYHRKYEYKNISYNNVEEDFDEVPVIDLFISNYAFSELRHEIQDFYITNFIDKATHAHIVCNWIDHSIPKPDLLARLPKSKIEVEIPTLTDTLYW